MTIRERFESPEVLIEALRNQSIVRGDQEVATALAEAGELGEFAPGQSIITQGADDSSIYFILAGRAQIVINGMRLFFREAGVSVGEMSTINSSLPRSATVEAIEPVAVLKVGSKQFLPIADMYPQLWKRLAVELSSRLEQRNRLLNRANIKPNVFVISSAESLPYARALRVGIERVAQTDIWSDEDIFRPGAYPLEALEAKVADADFGIAFAEPDDLVTSRGVTSSAPRDNVLFELGFFMSRLGRHRTLLIVPRSGEVKLPSDFKGLTPITYEKASSPSKSLGPAIDRVINVIDTIGVRASLVEPS